ncbi:hypothetical protein [Frateuria aurantia]|uniref:Uncharacterized protein n=1 Tax=Frateuria aurantia (strain ATCC 33424 / DSM 6220 / KCTC 2777 / LMG 1558 / NBRC 3245 / NCIMB 13370) TaxID=767434 RepID=H8L653_FRAAD|nr:hypothetical protein [Frateuria aurantia]AFC85897.1 hypothetical protein Fraau_1475 [Frateuria aurantia DSM 6220]
MRAIMLHIGLGLAMFAAMLPGHPALKSIYRAAAERTEEQIRAEQKRARKLARPAWRQ